MGHLVIAENIVSIVLKLNRDMGEVDQEVLRRHYVGFLYCESRRESTAEIETSIFKAGFDQLPDTTLTMFDHIPTRDQIEGSGPSKVLCGQGLGLRWFSVFLDVRLPSILLCACMYGVCIYKMYVVFLFLFYRCYSVGGST